MHCSHVQLFEICHFFLIHSQLFPHRFQFSCLFLIGQSECIDFIQVFLQMEGLQLAFRLDLVLNGLEFKVQLRVLVLQKLQVLLKELFLIVEIQLPLIQQRLLLGHFLLQLGDFPSLFVVKTLIDHHQFLHLIQGRVLQLAISLPRGLGRDVLFSRSERLEIA